MKKIIFMLSLCLLLVLTGCASETHASDQTVIDDFFAAYSTQDYQTASTYVASDSKEAYSALQSLISNEQLNTIVLNHMSDVSYKVLSSDVKEDTATIELRIIYRNAGGAFMNAIGAMYVEASEGKLSDNSPEEVTEHIQSLLLSHLNTELETMDRTRTVELVKENDQWRLVMTEEFKNALSGNMLNAIEELKIMGVQF